MTRFGRIYIGVVGAVGAYALAHSIYTVARTPFEFATLPLFARFAILVVLAMASGWFPFKVPGLKSNVYLSETFFFTLAILFGGERAVPWVAVDGLMICWRRKYSGEPLKVLFNFAEPVLSILAASAVFFQLYGGPPLALQSGPNIGAVLLPATAMAAVYFLLNSGLTALAMWFEGGPSLYRKGAEEPLDPPRRAIAWLSLALFVATFVPVPVSF